MSNNSLLPKYALVKSSIVDLIRNNQMKPGAQIPSISDLMNELKVSKITVVHALTELETDGIINRIHGKGTFVADPGARSQRNIESTTIAVIVPDIGNPFYSEVIRGIEKAVRRYNYSIQLFSSDYELSMEMNNIEMIKRKPFCGLVIAPLYQDRLYQISDFDWSIGSLPSVCIDYCPPLLQGKINFVGIDHYKGAMEAMNHLISLGHRNIALITTPVMAPERILGYQDALKQQNIEIKQNWIKMAESEKNVAPNILDDIINDISAIFCGNDLIAAQILNIIKDKNLNVPKDISIVGFDNVVFSKHLNPPLTTVDQQEEELGKIAGRILLSAFDSMKKWKGIEQIILQPTLIIRESTSKVF